MSGATSEKPIIDSKVLEAEKQAVEAHIDNEEEFEEFPVEDYKSGGNGTSRVKAWEDDWDNEKPKMSFSALIKQNQTS
uniref:26S proteasome complex subunit dss-1 n=1 Tax=Rhabditophanes sp. KR3021 TaxID=114890 RepID=A0AC35TVL2_9BILA